MRKMLTLCIALALCAGLLAGCGLGSFAPAGASSEVFAAPELEASSVASEPESLPEPEPESVAEAEATLQVNPAVLELLGTSNGEAKERLFTGHVVSGISPANYPSLVAEVEGFDYPMLFWLDGTDAEIEESHRIYAGAEKGEDGTAQGDIFPDGLRIEFISFVNEIVHNVLFLPGVPVTYETMNECFGQEPEMKLRDDVDIDYEMWDIEYYHDGYGYSFSMIEDNGQYIPIGGTMWEGGTEKLNENR